MMTIEILINGERLHLFKVQNTCQYNNIADYEVRNIHGELLGEIFKFNRTKGAIELSEQVLALVREKRAWK